jgi:hypothetical protein
MLEIINRYPLAFTIFVLIAFIGYIRSMYIFFNNRKK